MTDWNELNSRAKPVGLPLAAQRQTSPGNFRYTFVHDGLEVIDPSVDATGEFFVSPREYGFAIRGFKDGKTAWARDFGNGTMLVVNADGQSHVLSPKLSARILFVAPDGALLQDSGTDLRQPQRVPDLATVRLTVNVTFDLHGESPEVARTILMRMVDQAILAGPPAGQTDVAVVHHGFELSAVMSDEQRRSTDTDFSQLLDI
ncbi:MAG: hypothetical protein A3F78_15825 [Burkholderiales bacterium RIFCSPLOWO2_12_FULL_61_40]|nr:MAG: hypothetical protein A3F78_15825 [Burkholderiales bacterium RIFCSPLOWO2_12_FULL_61_40]